jgi:hypothetical protein
MRGMTDSGFLFNGGFGMTRSNLARARLRAHRRSDWGAIGGRFTALRIVMGFQGDAGRKAFADMVGLNGATLATSDREIAPRHHVNRILGVFNEWATGHYDSQKKLIEDVYDVLDKPKSQPFGPRTKH